MSEDLEVFYNNLKVYEDYEYLYSYLKYHLAPIRADLKPGSILNMTGELRRKWLKHGQEITLKLNLEWILLRETKNSSIIFLFRRDLIQKLIADEAIKTYLKQMGYKVESVESVITSLIRRYDKMHCPHEVGVLLGIPIEDVKGFIDNPKGPCLLKGYWKVYSNLEYAKALFKAYDYVKYQVIYSTKSAHQ